MPEGNRRASVWNHQTKHEPRLFLDAGASEGENGDEFDRDRLHYEEGVQHPGGKTNGSGSCLNLFSFFLSTLS